MVNDRTGTYEFTIDYYLLAQYSKFMPPGAIVLRGTGSYQWEDQTGIQSVATLNPDGTRSVVIQNTLRNSVYLTLNTASGQRWGGNIPADTVVTWVLPRR